MASFGRQLAYHVRAFANNWRTFDGPLGTKARLAVRNRARSLVNRGCCGNHGEPGC